MFELELEATNMKSQGEFVENCLQKSAINLCSEELRTSFFFVLLNLWGGEERNDKGFTFLLCKDQKEIQVAG